MSPQEVMARARERLGDALLSAQELVPGKVYLEAKPEAVTRFASLCGPEIGGRYLVGFGTDLGNGRLRVSHVFSLDQDRIFVVGHFPVSEQDPRIDSLTPLLPAASWAEREFRDLLGIEPVGHPDPRRLVVPDDWPADVYPLRKEVPYDYHPPAVVGQEQKLKEPPEGSSVLPIGPFYPVLEEPAQLRLYMDGERIVGCDYRGFYNHRGIEKMAEAVLTYNQIPFIAERICGICGFIHSTCYCQTAEEALGIEAPPRANFIRTAVLELERVQSHLLWLGIAAHIVGFDTLLMQTWRIREPLMWLAERILGARKTYGVNVVGGVRRDIPKESHEDILRVLAQVEREMLAVVDALPGDTSLTMRLKGVGVITPEVARAFAVVGPTARGSGLEVDARVDHPYAAYAEVPPNVAVQQEGDNYARVVVRLLETLDSIRMLREALKHMPDGPLVTEVTEDPRPGRQGVSTVEAPRGEAIHYLLTGGDNRPLRWRVRAPTYQHLQAVQAIVPELTVADVPITLGSLDPCFSCTERVEAVQVETGETRAYSEQELIALSRQKYGPDFPGAGT